MAIQFTLLLIPITAPENCTGNRRHIYMKTLNLTLRTILLGLVLVCSATSGLAYDFVVKGIYYNINGDEATVTYKRQYKEYTGYNGVYNTYYENDCVGDVSIPETVTYKIQELHLPVYHCLCLMLEDGFFGTAE